MATSRPRSSSCARRAWRTPPSAPTARRPKGSSATGWRATARAARWSPSAARPSRSPRTRSSRPSPRRRSTSSRRTASTPSRSSTRSAWSCPASSARTSPSPERARFEAVEGGRLGAYVHPPANKLGVLLQIRGGDDELARNLAMHISWSDPRWIGREDVPEDLVAAEREIYLNSEEVQSKPEQAREKIVTGMLDKRFFAERGGVLADQPWIHDGSQTRRQGSRRRGSRGARVRAVLARGMTTQPETETGRGRLCQPSGGCCSSSPARRSWASASTASTPG